MGRRPECTVFVGNLPVDIKERELDDLFYKFGRIEYIKIPRCSHPPAFALVEFEDRRDAEDAAYARDGYEFDGSKLRVEISKVPQQQQQRTGNGGQADVDDRERGGRFAGRAPYDNNNRGNNIDRRGGGRAAQFERTRRTDFCVVVRNLPEQTSWQDLKDFFRKSGKVTYANAFTLPNGEQMGEVDFAYLTDAENACDDCDGIEFRTRNGSSKIQCDLKKFRSNNKRGLGSNAYSDDEYDNKNNHNKKESRDDKRRSRSRSYSRSRSPSPRKSSKDNFDMKNNNKERFGGGGRSRSRSRSR